MTSVDKSSQQMRPGPVEFSIEQTLSQLMSLAEVILVAVDPEGRVIYVNDRGAQMLGWEARELVGCNWAQTCLPPEIREFSSRLRAAVLAGQWDRGARQERPVMTRSGERRWIAWRNQPLLDREGKAVGVLFAGEDVGATRAAIAASSEQEQRLRAVVETAVDAIITIDERGIIETLNPATEKMFGYSAAELIGRNVSMLMPSPYREHHDMYLRRYMDTGEARIIGIGREVLGQRKDGATFPIDLAVSELPLPGRRLFTGMVRDISARKQLERELLEISTQEQQRIGQDLHDGLGQELTGIAFLTDVLASKLRAKNVPEADEAKEIVGLANQAIDHTRALVRGLCPIRLAADGLVGALSELTESVQSVYGIDCRLQCDIEFAMSDYSRATHLYYIAHEAITNAIRHGKASRIIVRTQDLPQRRAELTIRDNGVGLPAERSRPGRGLHIMTFRASALGGTVRVDPVAGGGTIVSCVFPLPVNSGESTEEERST